METNRGRHKFGKKEKLRHKNLVNKLFEEGEAIYDFPLRLTWHILSKESLSKSFRGSTPEGIGKVQMMVTIPKKKRKRAVDRVLLRRRIREAYRLHNGELKERVKADAKIGTMSLAFVYIHTENVDYHLIEKKMQRLLDKLTENVAKEPDTSECAPTL